MKVCTKCQNEKPVEAFSKNAAKADGLQQWCKQCAHARRAEWAREDTSRARKYRLRYNYGLTEEQFDSMLETQGNKCLLCNEEFSSKTGRCVDHDHATGRVRGILCTRCNIMVGWYEAISDHDKVIDYLKDR